MQNEYANRQNMHLTVLKLIDSPDHEAVWKNQKPTAFTTRAAQLRPLVESLTDLIAGQQTATTGYAETKEREEQELENLAHEIGQTLADWYEENGREGDSAQIDLSLTAWQRLRDTELIAKSRLLHQKLTAALARAQPDSRTTTSPPRTPPCSPRKPPISSKSQRIPPPPFPAAGRSR